MTKELISKYIQEKFLPNQDQRITINEVWKNRFRVNIWEEDPNRVTYSFFIKTDKNEIIYCNPSIVAA